MCVCVYVLLGRGGETVCVCARQAQTEWPCLCIFAASRVQDGGCHQLWSKSRNNQQQQLQQRGSSASGVSGLVVVYVILCVDVCFSLCHLFVFGGVQIEKPENIFTSNLEKIII